MCNVLVTGGAGFIGVNFVYYWLRHHPQDRVIILDSLTYAGRKESLDKALENAQCRFVPGNIKDLSLVKELLRQEKIDTLVHFAAESHVDRSIEGPDAFIDTNIQGTHTLLKAAVQIWLKEETVQNPVFHHVSTDEVFGSLSPQDPPFQETTPYAPNSPYSASKAASDHLVRAYHHTYGLPVKTSHCSNNYGPYQFPEKLIPLMISHALSGKPLPVYGTGQNIRDWLFVEDHCRAIDLIIHKGKYGETYNIGGQNEQTNLAVVQILCDKIDRHFQNNPALAARFPTCPAAQKRSCRDLITYVKDRAGHDWRYAIDTGKIRKELGYQPQETFDQGLDKTLTWYLENEHWWGKIKQNR